MSLSQVPAHEDLTVTIGGRKVSPALPLIDASKPSEVDQSFQGLLQSYMDANVSLETTEGIRRRERVLTRLGALCDEWVQSVARDASLPEEAVRMSRGLLFTSGSYRLGVHEPGADMDVVLVCPSACTRKDFFGSGYVPPGIDLDTVTDPKEQQALRESIRKMRDPQSLAERIKRHADVTNCIPIENAAVPILTFDWEGVSIDLLFARIHSKAVLPADFDIDDDAVLDGVDTATEKSLNGPRVTNLIAALVSANTQRYQNFLTVVRCVRRWAKARGLYSNKMGFWGGVNINIAVALVIQLYPNASAASLLRKFFLVFKSWRWPNPVILTKPHDAGYGLNVWTAASTMESRMHNVAPMITPAYPAMNSSASVSRQTLQILIEEFARAHDIMDRAWKQHVAGGTLHQPPAMDILSTLFQPSDFFIAYPYYLSLCIVGPTEADQQTWAGFVESRLRKLISDWLGRRLPLSKIQLWPKKIDACVADKTALLTAAQRKHSITYFVGFHVDHLRMKGMTLNLEQQLQKFSQLELSRFHATFVPGMDVLVKAFTVKTLPTICFEGIYHGGKLAAMKKRRFIRDSDPVRILAKNNAKLANIQKEIGKKKSMLQEEIKSTSTKRKRSVDEQDETEDKDERDYSSPSSSSLTTSHVLVKVEEDQALLEHVLDELQGQGVTKSREEAERDRQILLSGEGFHEGGESDPLDSNRMEEEEDDNNNNNDDDELGYGPDGARRLVVDAQSNQEYENNLISIAEREAEVLHRSGFHIIPDDEKVIMGGNWVQPWRKSDAVRNVVPLEIVLHTKFDVVELDVNGKVVDVGDDDFMPSLRWVGRHPGFEFKLGDRGLGYYRTGKPVIVPSNLAY